MPANSKETKGQHLGLLLRGQEGVQAGQDRSSPSFGTFVTLHDNPDAGPHAFVDEFCFTVSWSCEVNLLLSLVTYQEGGVEKP